MKMYKKRPTHKSRSIKKANKATKLTSREEGLLQITLGQSLVTVCGVTAVMLAHTFGVMPVTVGEVLATTLNRNDNPVEMVMQVTEVFAFTGDGYGGELLTEVFSLYQEPVSVPDTIPELPLPPTYEELPQQSTVLSLAELGEAVETGVLIGGNTSIPELAFTLPDEVVKGGVITCPFGMRTHPISGKEDFHTGVDIGAEEGTPITAPLAGIVTKVGENTTYGNYLVVSHSDNIITLYGHCQQIWLTEGELVELGEEMATVGNTGISTGPHLHFEVTLCGSLIDPLDSEFSIEEI